MDRKKWTSALVFCVVLGAGTLASVLNPQREYSDRENRTLADRPELTAENIVSGVYQEGYENWLNDQFPLRDRWVSLSAYTQCIFGKKDINGVYLGKDGYLIEKPDDSDFDREQLEENIHILSRFLNDAVKAYGKDRVCCMMVPSKAAVLTNHLPLFAGTPDPICDGTISGQIKNTLMEPDILLDLTDCLRAHQNEYIYYRTDHHWTTLGAYYAYAAWAGQTRHIPLPLTVYRREAVYSDFYGTTYNKVHIKTTPDTVTLYHGPCEDGIRVCKNDGPESSSLYALREADNGSASNELNRYDVFFGGNTGKIAVKTGADTDRTLLVIKDSFANCLVPFLIGDYSRIIMIDYRYTKKSIADITEENDDITDVLVVFNTDKFCRDTGLRPLAGEFKSETMEEFDAEEFFSDLE